MAVQGNGDSRGLTIPALIAAVAAVDPDAPALLAPSGEHVSFGLLLEQTRRIAGQLRSLGIRSSDRVAIVHPNGPELAGAFLGVASAAVCAPLNPSYRPSELDFYLADLDAKAILVGAGEQSPVRDLATRRGTRLVEIQADGGGGIRLSRGRARGPRVAEPDDTALILHTSGTTARPKLVPLTHGRLVLSARNVARTLELTPDDRCLNVMPLFHIHAIVGTLLSSLSAGASVVCAPRFHAPSFHRWLAETGPTWYSAVPTMHQAVLERARDLDPSRGSTLRLIRSSSAPLPPRVYESLAETFGVPVVEAYGMTEAAHQMTSNPLPPGQRKAGSVGIATHIEVGVRGEDGRMLGVGETGEIVIRGETVFAGYEANPEANAEAFVDGWFRTGDEGSLDEDGYLFLRGRTKEIINRAGEKVSPGEVEDVLLRHPDVAQAVSFAVPHERLGEDVGAAVILRDGATATERDVQEHAAASLAHFKVPSVVMVVDEIPVGATGKLQRIGLAERLGIGEMTAHGGAAEYVAPATPAEREMAELWASVLDVERIGREDDFFALGGDSILGAELVARLAQQRGQELPLTTLMWAPTLGEFTALIEAGSWDTDSRIVPVQPNGFRPPLFVTHALYDEVFNIGALKRTLGSDQPLYALRAVAGMLDFPSIEELAREYFAEVRKMQPSGPYLFASVCSGSAVVAEMTRHARAAGHEVAVAAVIDPRADIGRGFFRHYTRRTTKHARRGTLWFAVTRKLRHWRSHLVPGRYPDPELENDPLGTALSSMRRRYRLRRLPGEFTVIATMEYRTPREVWEGLADEIRWHELAVPHGSLFQQPNADTLGALLAHVIADALADGRRS